MLLSLDTLVNNNKVINNITDEQQVILHGPTIKGNYHDVQNNYNAGFQWFAAGLQNLDTLVNNNKVINNITDKQEVILHGPTIKGNYHDVQNNYNAGFQWFAAGLQNLDSLVNNNKVINNIKDDQSVILHGPTVNRNYHDVQNNNNAGFQQFGLMLL